MFTIFSFLARILVFKFGSAPELKEKKVYNNSIDMWSMGVIIYVCLSGEFPFDEDQNIQEQLVNIDLFPDVTWKKISLNGKFKNFVIIKKIN